MTPSVIVDRRLLGRIPRSLTRSVAHRLRRAAQRLNVDREVRSTFCVRLVDDREMARLHELHMSEPGPTDVMSFPAAELPRVERSGVEPLGDVVIDWDFVVRRAPRLDGSTLEHETVSLGLHGLVHLLGHDHGTREQARAMLRRERVAARGARLGELVRPYGGRRR